MYQKTVRVLKQVIKGFKYTTAAAVCETVHYAPYGTLVTNVQKVTYKCTKEKMHEILARVSSILENWGKKKILMNDIS